MNTDIGLSVDNKKRKTNGIYLIAKWNDKDDYEVTKLRHVIHSHIFKHVKFVKGEGALLSHKKKQITTIEKISFGKCHEISDLTMLSRYECQTLRTVELSEKDSSVLRRALWLKMYNTYVHQEIRQLRGRMNSGIKSSISQGEPPNLFIHNCTSLFTYILSVIARKCQNECQEAFDIMEFTRFLRFI